MSQLEEFQPKVNNNNNVNEDVHSENAQTEANQSQTDEKHDEQEKVLVTDEQNNNVIDQKNEQELIDSNKNNMDDLSHIQGQSIQEVQVQNETVDQQIIENQINEPQVQMQTQDLHEDQQEENNQINNEKSQQNINTNIQNNLEQNELSPRNQNIQESQIDEENEQNNQNQENNIQNQEVDQQNLSFQQNSNEQEQINEDKKSQNEEQQQIIEIQLDNQQNDEKNDQEINQMNEQSHKLDDDKFKQIQNQNELNYLYGTIEQKDQLIKTLYDEISLLKLSQQDKQEKIELLEIKYQKQIDDLNKKIDEMDKCIKEKETDLEQYRNGNQTLHLQDLSVITKGENLKSNLNDKKDVTIFDVLNEKQANPELSELGNNFWLVSAERKMSKNNPIYKDYVPKETSPEQKNKKIVNYPTKKYEKSFWFQYVEVKKPIRYNINAIQLPKLQETRQDPIYQQKIKQLNDQQQQLMEQIQQNPSFGMQQQSQSKKTQINSQISQQVVPFSQKLLAANQKGSSQSKNPLLINNNKMYSSQPNILKAQHQVQIEADDFLADQEIETMFAQYSHPKKQVLDWDEQPNNNYLVVQHTNSSQVIEQKERYPILSQKLSYVNQYSQKKEFSRLNESQNQQNRTKLSKNL